MDTTIDKETVSLRKIIIGYIHHWRLFLSFFIVSVVISILYLLLYPTTYEVMARIQLQEDKELGTASLALGEAAGLMKSFGLGSGGGATVTMDDELAKLTSNKLLKEMVLDLNLNVSYKKPWTYNYEMYNDIPIRLIPDSITNQELTQKIFCELSIDNQESQ